MTPEDQKAILTLCLMSALSDGASSDRERDELKRIAASLETSDSVPLSTLYRDVLLNRVNLQTVAGSITAVQSRQLAYELAICVCNADERVTEVERAWLVQLRKALQLPDPADDTAMAPAPLSFTAVPAGTDQPTRSADPGIGAAAVDEAEIDQRILNAAIISGALELLPQSVASMAIIPLQMRLVYGIGKTYGYDLDRGHIKDLLATVGVGLTSQYVEQVGRRLLGGLLGGLAGSLGRAAGHQTASSALAFATTWALGQVARHYYAGGRQLDTGTLQASFSGLREQADVLRTQYLPQIEARAKTIDTGKLLALVRQA